MRLSDDHVRALRAHVDEVELDDDAGRAAAQELRDAGLITGPLLHPLLVDHVRVMTFPALQLAVEVHGPQGDSVANVVVSGRDVWASDPWPSDGRDGAVAWTRSEVPTLLWDLARLVGLRTTAVPADAVPLRADLGSVDGLLSVLAQVPPEERERARLAVLARSGEHLAHLPGEARVRWTALLATLQSSWRISCAWGGVRGDVRSLAVLDCGDEGYWQRVEPTDALAAEDLVATTPVHLEPVDAARLWQAVSDLLPSSAELRAAASA